MKPGLSDRCASNVILMVAPSGIQSSTELSSIVVRQGKFHCKQDAGIMKVNSFLNDYCTCFNKNVADVSEVSTPSLSQASCDPKSNYGTEFPLITPQGGSLLPISYQNGIGNGCIF